MSTRVDSKWEDGKMDMKVKFQSLGLSICVNDLRGNIVCPQLKEHLVISIFKAVKEVFLEIARNETFMFWLS